MRDDGVGSYVAERLIRMDLGEDVTVIDYGTAGFKLLNDILDYDYVIFVDSIVTSEKPGTIVSFDIDPSDVVAADSTNSQNLFQLSSHEIDIESILSLSKAMGHLPRRIKVIGIVPKEVSSGLGLSTDIAKNFMRLVNLIKDEVMRMKEID